MTAKYNRAPEKGVIPVMLLWACRDGGIFPDGFDHEPTVQDWADVIGHWNEWWHGNVPKHLKPGVWVLYSQTENGPVLYGLFGTESDAGTAEVVLDKPTTLAVEFLPFGMSFSELP